MRMPSAAQRKSLEKATANYQTSVLEAASYLAARGLDLEAARRWRLGVVYSPEPGHEQYLGRLVIPYLNKTGVIGLKFRCIIGHDCKEANCTKYLQPDGQEKFLFNVCDVDSTGEVIHITEGEMDTIVLREALGEPTVGAPGTGIWQAHWAFHFHGYQRVLAWPDGDKAGKDWGNRLRKEIPNVEIVQMPRGSDVGELFLELGPEALRELAGVDDSTALEVTHV